MNNPNIPRLDPDPLAGLTGHEKPLWERLRESVRKFLSPTVEELAGECTQEDVDFFNEFMGKKADKKSGKPQDKGEPKDALNAADIRNLKGFKYFEAVYDNDPIFYENADVVCTLITFLKDYHSTKQRSYPSLTDKFNIDFGNLLAIAIKTFEEISGQSLKEEDIASWFDRQKSVDPLQLIFSEILHCEDTDDSKKIIPKIEKFNDVIDRRLPGFKDFWRPKANKMGAINYGDLMADIEEKMGDLYESNPDEEALLAGREKILKNIKPIKSDVSRWDEALLKNKGHKSPAANSPDANAPVPEKKIDFLELIKRDDVREARLFLQQIEDAFEAADQGEYDANHKQKFNGESAIEVMSRLQAEFPGLRLGNLLLKVNNPNSPDNLLELIANRLGVTDADTFVEQINEIHNRLAAIYPNI